MNRRNVFPLVAALFMFATYETQPAVAQTKNSPKPPTKSQCIDANTAGQSLRLSGQLDEARKELTLCSDAACPSLVRTDCTQRLDELSRIQPTLVLGLKNASGADVTDAKVTMDGKPFVDRLDGSAVPVNPGEHVFVLTIPGESPITRKFVIKEGEKGRLEQISLVPAETPATNASGLGTQKILGITAVSLGVVGLGLGGVFGAMASSAAEEQKKNCPSATNCPNRDEALANHTTAEKMGNASTIAFVGGGVFVVAGAILFLAAPRPTAKAAQMHVLPAFGAHGGGMLLMGNF